MNTQAILGTIHNALNANIAFLDEATQYTLSFSNMLKIFLRHYNSIPMEVPNLNKKIPMILRVEREHIIDNPEPTLTRSWQKIAKDIFCNEPVENFIENIEKNLILRITELKAKYSSKIGLVEQSIQNSYTDLINIEQQYQLLYQEYEKLCQAIEKFHGNPSQKEKYDKLKFKYKGTQKAAVDKLVELNHKILEYNLQIERSLTKYEEAEKQKFDELFSFIFDFSKTLKNISDINKKITNNVSNEVSTISPQNDVDQFVDDSALQKVPSRIRLSRKASISGSTNSTETIQRLEQNLNAKSAENNKIASETPSGINSPTKAQESKDTQNNEVNQKDDTTHQNDEVKQDQQQEEAKPNETVQTETKQNSEDVQKETTQTDLPNDELQQNQQVQTRNVKFSPDEITQQNDQNESTQQENNESNQNDQKQEEQEKPQETQQENESNQNDQKQEEQVPQVQSNEQNETLQQDQPQNEVDQKETTKQAEETDQNTQQNEQKQEQQIPLDSLSPKDNQKADDNEITKFPSLVTSSGTENFSVDSLIEGTSTEEQIEAEALDQEITFFEITKMFTFDIGNYLSPEEIFKSSLNNFDAILTEDSGSFHKGDEVTVLSTDSHKGAIVIDHEGNKGSVELSKLQKTYERKIMKVQTQIDDGELEVEVGEYVLVVYEREGFSKCLSAYREEGIILSSKLVPYEPK